MPVHPDLAWGAWDGSELVAALALCREEDAWVLRGPEIWFRYRRMGLGAALLKLAEPALVDRKVYVVSYMFLLKLYRSVGFEQCPDGEVPAFLARILADLTKSGWQLRVLRHNPH